MLQNIMRGLLAITTVLFGLSLFGMFSPGAASINTFLSSITILSPFVNAAFAISLMWMFVGRFYNSKDDKEYSEVRHFVMSALFAIPFVAIIFSPTMLYPYIVGKAFLFRTLIIVAFVGYLYLALTNKNFKPRITPLTVSFTVFAAMLGLSTLFSIDTYRSFFGNYERMEGYFGLLCVAMLVVTLASVRLKDVEWSKLFKVHAWIATIVSGLGILQYIVYVIGAKSLAGLPILSLCFASGAACRVDSTLGNPIYLGIYAAITFWLFLYAAIKNPAQKTLLFVLAFVQLLAVYLSVTRSAMLGIVLGLAVAAVMYFVNMGNKKKALQFVAAGAVLVAVVVGALVYMKNNNIMQDVYLVQRFSSVATLFSRVEVWKIAITGFMQHPVFGVGQENFIHVFNSQYNPAMYGQETYFDHPHNTYLGWLVMGGLLGFLSYIFMLSSVVWATLKTYTENKSVKESAMLLSIVAGALVTYFFHIFFVFDNLTSVLIFAMLAVYLTRHVSYGALALPDISMNLRKPIAIILSLVVAISGYLLIGKPAYANNLVIQSLTKPSSVASPTPIDIVNGTQDKFSRALALNTFGNYEINELYLKQGLDFTGALPQLKNATGTPEAIKSFVDNSKNSFLGQINDASFDHRSRFMYGLYNLQTANMADGVKYLQEAVNLAPNKQVALIALAKAQLVNKETDKAFANYQKAIDVTPKDNLLYNSIRIEAIKSLMLVGKDKEALAVIKDMLPAATRIDFNALVSQMMQVYSGRNDLKGLVTLLVEANQLDPNNPNFVFWLAQALVIGGKYEESAKVINTLSPVYPQVVDEFMKQLNSYVGQLKAKRAEQQAATAPTVTKPVETVMAKKTEKTPAKK
jgi:tetratricopeptide (TPR) repeat protein